MPIPTSARRASLALLPALVALACGGPPAATTPARPETVNLARAFAEAMDAESADSAAADAWLDAVDLAVEDPAAPGALATVVAALDALVFGAVPSIDEIGPTAIAYRSKDAMRETAGRLAGAWAGAGAGATFLRGTIAAAEHQLALYLGDAQAAALWAERRGCASEATVIGPTDASPLVGLEGPAPVAATAPLAAEYAGVAPFAARLVPTVVRADACRLDVNSTSFLQGLRVIVVDFESPRAQKGYFTLTTTSAAVVEIGGVKAIRRGFEAGGSAVTRLATVSLPAGKVRAVIRVAQKNDGNLLELDAWGEDGERLAAHAPRPGDAASGRASSPGAIEIEKETGLDAPRRAATDDILALTAAGLLGLGESRAAEHLLEAARQAEGERKEPRPARLELLYARAVEQADDLPPTKEIERIRASVDAVIAAKPEAWEALIAHARLTERRRGYGEGVVEAIKELGGAAPQTGGKGKGDRVVLAYLAAVARRAQMIDLAEAAYRSLEKVAAGSAMLANADMRLRQRVGADQVRAACAGGTNRSENLCLDAQAAVGDLKKVLAEIGRLRTLRGSPEALRDVELYHRVWRGDLQGALAIYEAMPPAQRSLLLALALAAGKGETGLVRTKLARDQITARDAPFGIGALVRALGIDPDPAPDFEAEGRKIVDQDRKNAFLPGAGTAVLRHVERYTIDRTGLVRYTSYDLRRVSGTTDVERGAPSFGPMIEGRGAPRLLRRRIHKKDGRVLEPDAAANAAQGNSDLSQLEQGDYVEQILEGWALPGDAGQLVIDTPDLLPERTSVREAEIEIRRDPAIPFAVWSHALLGKPEERTAGGYKVSVWRMKERPPRRIEDGVPRMERNVSVSLGTQTWANVARAIDDNIRSLTDRDPIVKRWADEAAGADKKPSRALVERVVAAAGKKVKVAQGQDLSDVAAVYNGGAQRTTARTILELGQGSRSWLVYRALGELGIKAEIAVAETEPFSASPDFPAHVGRFRHPLVVAHLEGGDVWIDADVEGPPLPPGRISPELRGRAAMLATGKLVTVEGASGETGDEVDVRLALDAKGDAKGTFTVLLHGRPAQALSEAFETVVGTERQQLLRGVVLAWLPWADVEDVSLSSTEGSWEVALRATIKIHGYGRPEGKDGKVWALPGLEPVHFVFPRAFVGTLGATYASRGARQSALSIDAPLQYHVHRRVELPEGASVTRAPASVAVKDARIEAQRKSSQAARVLEEDFSLSLPTGTVSAEGYQAFVQNVHAIDDGFMAVTRVKVKP